MIQLLMTVHVGISTCERSLSQALDDWKQQCLCSNLVDWHPHCFMRHCRVDAETVLYTEVSVCLLMMCVHQLAFLEVKQQDSLREMEAPASHTEYRHDFCWIWFRVILAHPRSASGGLCFILNFSHKAWKSVQRFDLGPGSRKIKDRTGHSKSHKGVIFHLFGEKPPLNRFSQKFAQ